MTSDTELVERLREAARDIRNDGTPSQVGLTDAECEQVASAIERLCEERDEARGSPWRPDACPITGRPFFMWIDGEPTYGGPFDSYTIPVSDEAGEFGCRRYDHDEGGWVEGLEAVSVRLVDDVEDEQVVILRGIIADCASALPNGAFIDAERASLELMAHLPQEIEAVCDRLCAERDEAREGGTPEAKRLLAQIDALTKRAAEAEREVARKSQTFCAMLTTGVCDLPERLDAAESRAAALEQEVVRLGALVERAFRDGLTYATNVVVTDPDVAWQFSRVRAALQAEDKP